MTLPVFLTTCNYYLPYDLQQKMEKSIICILIFYTWCPAWGPAMHHKFIAAKSARKSTRHKKIGLRLRGYMYFFKAAFLIPTSLPKALLTFRLMVLEWAKRTASSSMKLQIKTPLNGKKVDWSALTTAPSSFNYLKL